MKASESMSIIMLLMNFMVRLELQAHVVGCEVTSLVERLSC